MKNYANLNEDKLNIAMIGHKRLPSREGGVEVCVEELSTRMVRNGCSVTVYNRDGHHVSGKKFGINGNLYMYRGVEIHTVPTIKRRGLAALTSSFFSTLKAIIDHYDCIHYHAEGPCAMLWIPHLFHIRTVATIHGLDWQRSKWGRFASWYLKQGEKIAAKYADEVIVLSKNTQKYFRNTYQRETVFIPNGVNKPKQVQVKEIKDKWGLEKDSYLCYLSRLVPEKGVQYLIEAFKNVKTNKKLVIAGGTSDTDQFYKKIVKSASLDSRIIFTGFVQGRELEELYSNAYLYVLPSELEGMPLSLLEAMSYGNCCVVSQIEECTEVIEDKGVKFMKSNVDDLKEKLQELCDNVEIVNRYKAEVADFICKKYDWMNVVNQTIQLYKDKRNLDENIDGE